MGHKRLLLNSKGLKSYPNMMDHLFPDGMK